MPVIDRKFSSEALRNIQGSQATFYILLSQFAILAILIWVPISEKFNTWNTSFS